MNSKSTNFNRVIYLSVFLFSILFLASNGMLTNNHALGVNPSAGSLYSISTKEYAYTFQIANKLAGNGEIKLTIERNKLKGIATGIGMTCQCNVDFHTNIEGDLNSSSKSIKVEVEGIGNPIGILIPGKVSFRGPLKGFLEESKLKLVGKVKIKGYLARCAGFKHIEEILIEIPDPTLAKTFKQIQNQGKLASL